MRVNVAPLHKILCRLICVDDEYNLYYFLVIVWMAYET